MSGNLVVSEALFAATEQDVLRVQAGGGDGQGPEQCLLSPADGKRKRENGLAVSWGRRNALVVGEGLSELLAGVW